MIKIVLKFARIHIPEGYTFMSRNKQSQKYLIGRRSYKNVELDWPFDLVTATWKYNPPLFRMQKS